METVQKVDSAGNMIQALDDMPGLEIIFSGSNNIAIIHPQVRIRKLKLEFNCSDAVFQIGSHSVDGAFEGLIRLGEGSQVLIGNDVTCTAHCFITASEYARVVIGNDCMFATANQIRTDDAHPIFDVRTGLRLNPAEDVVIADHVWLAYGAKVLGGSEIGEGTIVGMDSLVKGSFSNNCVIAGKPAKMIRTDVAWERPHLSFDEPYYKPNSSFVNKSKYWNLTKQPAIKDKINDDGDSAIDM